MLYCYSCFKKLETHTQFIILDAKGDINVGFYCSWMLEIAEMINLVRKHKNI